MLIELISIAIGLFFLFAIFIMLCAFAYRDVMKTCEQIQKELVKRQNVKYVYMEVKESER